MGVAEFYSGKTVFNTKRQGQGFWLVGQSLLTLDLNEKTLRDHVQVLIWTRSYMNRIKGTKKGTGTQRYSSGRLTGQEEA